MPEWVEIPFRDPSSSTGPELWHLLDAIETHGSKLRWTLRFVEAVGDVTEVWEDGILDLERRADDERDGLRLGWARPTALAQHIDQVIECRFDGVRGEADGHRPDDLELVIQAIDSSVWSIYARDSALLDPVVSRYRPVRRGVVHSVEQYLAGPGSWV